MQAQLETVGTLERRLNISIPASQIDEAIANKLRKVARTARIQGFRPGKAPLRIVEQNYGLQVREEVLNDAVQGAFSEAINSQKLRVAGYPRFEGQPPEEGDFRFSAQFEVYPEVSLGDLTGRSVDRPTLEVTDTEIDRTLEILRKQRSRFERVERPAEAGDRVILDFTGTIDDVAFPGGSASNHAFLAGTGQMLPEFDAAVLGMKEGERKTFDLSFPADYHGKEVAGKTAQFEVVVHNVAMAILPEMDAEFARALGIADGDVGKMREEVQRNVEREVKRRLANRAREAVMQVLIETTPLELPKALIELEQGRLMEGARQEMEQRGINPATMPLAPVMFTEQAKRRVHLGLVLAELVHRHELTAKPEQVRAIVEEMADSYEHPAEVVQWYYASQDRLEGPASIALEANVVDFVYATASPVDRPLSFEDLMSGA